MLRRPDFRTGLVLAGLGLMMFGSCVPEAGTDPPSTNPVGPQPKTAIRIFVPATARAVGAVLPIQVEADAPLGPTASDRCVAVHAEPGEASFVFPQPCEGAGVGQGGFASADATSCVHFASGKGSATAMTLGEYHPVAKEKVVTLFAALYSTASCTGAPDAQNTLVIHLGDEGNGAGGANEGGAPASGTGGAPEGGSSGTAAGGAATGGTSGAGGSSGAAGTSGAGDGGMPSIASGGQGG